FCVITPYDAQRAEIAGQLKALSLPWEDVYNVDSFQGHEAPYVIISTVRTSAPGFLRSQNRINVMLTRCERGMVLVSNRRFLTGPGRSTLLGELALQWSRGTW
ncbi:AAA domain-containing protein, partial [Trametes meyenii]